MVIEKPYKYKFHFTELTPRIAWDNRKTFIKFGFTHNSNKDFGFVESTEPMSQDKVLAALNGSVGLILDMNNEYGEDIIEEEVWEFLK